LVDCVKNCRIVIGALADQIRRRGWGLSREDSVRLFEGAVVRFGDVTEPSRERAIAKDRERLAAPHPIDLPGQAFEEGGRPDDQSL